MSSRQIGQESSAKVLLLDLAATECLSIIFFSCWDFVGWLEEEEVVVSSEEDSVEVLACCHRGFF